MGGFFLVLLTMPPVFVGIPSTDELIDSIGSYFDGMNNKPSIPEDGTIAEVLEAITKGTEQIFTKSEKDIKSFFAEFCALFQKLKSDEASLNIVEQIIPIITKETSDQPKLRLSILNRFYNFFPYNSNLRYNFFLSILHYTVAIDLTKAIIPALCQVDELLQNWGASTTQKREIYKAICQVYLVSNPNSPKLFENQKKYLETYQGNEDDVSDAKQCAVDASVLALKLENVNRCDDLLELRAVKQLQSDSTHQKLYELLQLFCEQKLDAFEAFNKGNSEFFGTAGLSVEDCRKKMRLFSLTTLAAESNTLSYSQIAEQLSIEEGEVESWVICADQLVDARMDQANEKVYIRHANSRSFGDDEWKTLQSTLHSWKDNVE